MKKNISLLLLSASALLLAGCNADDLADGDAGQVPVSLTVTLGDSGGTRTTNDLHSHSTGFVVDETMKVFMKSASTTTSKVYKVTESTSGTATLGPNTDDDPLYYPTGTSGTVSLYAVYPATITSGGTHTVAYDQTTDDNYKSSDLMYSAGKDVSLSSKTSPQSLNEFQHKMVRLKLNIVKSSDVGSVTQIVMNNVKRKVTVSTLNESGITLSAATQATGETGEGADADKILVFSGTNASTDPQTYYVVFPKQVTDGNDWDGTTFLTVTADGATATYSLTKAFTTGSQYELTLNINAAALGSTVAINDWTDTEGATVQPTTSLEAVDMGLSVLWANMNVGAYSEADYGNYFAWGDVAGYGGAVSDGTTAADGYSFDWTNYKYANGGSNRLIKYCSDAIYGNSAFTDALSTLQSSDDAAAMHWGSGWRMPTVTELRELFRTYQGYNQYNDNYGSGTKIEGYTWTWCNGTSTKYKGSSAAGWQITRDETGATIFLPAAGDRSNAEVSFRDNYGYYWSSSVKENYPYNAWFMYFQSNLARLNYSERRYGYSVRAVRDRSISSATAGDVGRIICLMGISTTR